jgi:hypothetical protein
VVQRQVWHAEMVTVSASDNCRINTANGLSRDVKA